MPMKNMGKAVKMAFVTSKRSACERKTEVQVNVLSHLLTRGRIPTTFGLVRPRGRPKYRGGIQGQIQRIGLVQWVCLFLD